jgi:glycosyltransferase involved in cell wall biosynthesis
MDVWIVFVGETLPMDEATRTWRYGMLAETLASRGHHVTLWVPTFNHSHKKQRYHTDYTYEVNKNYKIELIYNIGYKRNIGFQRLLSYILLARSFKWRIKNEKPPDIIISGMPTPWLCSVAIKYGQQKHIPVIIDVRDLWPDIFVDVFPNKFRAIARTVLSPLFVLNKNLFRKATAIYGISRSYLEWGVGYANRKRIEGRDKVFPLGYKEISLSCEQVRSEKECLKNKGVDPSKLICCYFGQLESTYDVETIIEAANALKSRSEWQVQFVLCGEGSKMKSLLNMFAELDNVLLLGWVAPATLNVLMRISTIGLVSYAKDAPQSLPNKPFEYFSGGLPVISSLHGELKQILSENHCGLTYEAGDVQGLVDAILYLKNNPKKREQMGENARRLYEKKYSSDKIYPVMADNMEKIVYGNDKIHCDT